MSSTIRTRIAPSPTGMPHIGTVFQALFDYVFAHKHSGQFLIRIEDTDQTRLVADAESAIYQALEWFQLTPDEGPVYGGDFGPYRQSQRLEIYQQHAQTLIDQGHAYYCFCSPERLTQVRQEMQQVGKPPMYDQHCLHLDPKESALRAQTQPHVVRLHVPSNQTITFTDLIRGQINFDSNTVDDQVVLKSDGFPTYHLAVVVDDHLMNISHVVRGEEWISSTPKHILLYRFFGWKLPQFIHTPLLRNPDHSKLSKRHGHASVSWYRDQGYIPEATLNFLATRVWNHPKGQEIFSLQELIHHFDWKDMHIQGPVVDLDKLDWYNGQYIRKLSPKELTQRLKPYLPSGFPSHKLSQVVPLIQDRLTKLSDFTHLTSFISDYQLPHPDLLLKKSTAPEVHHQLETTIKSLKSLSSWTSPHIESAIRQLQEQKNWHKSQYFMMIRLSVTGKATTPPLFETLTFLGKTTTLTRLQQALSSTVNLVE